METGQFYFAGNRTFLNCVDSQKKVLDILHQHGAHSVHACSRTPYFIGVKRMVDNLWISRFRAVADRQAVDCYLQEGRTILAVRCDPFIGFLVVRGALRAAAGLSGARL